MVANLNSVFAKDSPLKSLFAIQVISTISIALMISYAHGSDC